MQQDGGGPGSGTSLFVVRETENVVREGHGVNAPVRRPATEVYAAAKGTAGSG